MEVAAVQHIACDRVDDGIVAGRVEFFLEHAARAGKCLGYGPQYLWGASQRVVGLHLVLKGRGVAMAAVVELVLAFPQALAPLCQLAHAAGHALLPLVPSGRIELLAHHVVVGRCYLVYPHCRSNAPVEQPLGHELVDYAYSSHHRGAIGERKPFSYVYL